MDVIVPFKARLDADRTWALWQGSLHFERANCVWNTLRTATGWFRELNLPFAVVGSLAMFLHGYRRFTQDVDILVTEDGLRTIQESLPGWGFQPANSASTHLRDVMTGVKVELLVTGRFPGSNSSIPVTFPDPAAVSTLIEGFPVVSLPVLIEMKLASGMSHPLRLRDIGDIQQLTMELELDESFADGLNPFVRDKFLEIVRLIRENPVQPE